MGVEIDNALLIHAVDRSPDGIVIVDERGVIHFANESMGTLAGRDPAEFVGRSVEELVPAELRQAHAAHRSKFNEHPTQRAMGSGMELTLLRRDGAMVPVEISLSPLEHAGQRYVVAAVRDMTERRENQRRLAAATEQLMLAAERERIGRDLHDVVLQHLYGTGLALQAIGVTAGEPVAAQIDGVIDEVDDIISEVRTIVFALGTAMRRGNLGQDLADVMAQASRVLGFTPSLRLEGPVESVISDDLRGEMVASMREALGNVARHAQASAASVVVSIDGPNITMTVTDNGVGPPADLERAYAGGHGLANLASRAVSLGGTCSLGPAPGGGAVLRWRAPFSADDAS
ncbi:MAG TPA: PAS domain S-box protein [Ilumatobacteraceae bacterium]